MTQWVEVSAHPRLVGDDRGVLRIGLAVTAVGARGVMHNPSRNVEELLVVVEQQRDQQRRAAGIQIDRPSNRSAISYRFDRSDQITQSVFVVGDASG